jgi:hypothetical protein
MPEQFEAAPALQVSQWINTPHPLDLASLRGSVVAVFAFQMLCPACVAHSMPQALRLREAFDPEDLVVLGLHTVFEHHDAMTPVALRAFAHEYRLQFPIGVDQPAEDGNPIPLTMRTYALQGTPSLLLIDRAGRLRLSHFGHLPDLQLGALVARLAESA